MTEAHKASWTQYALLLGALAAGTLTTQLMPAFQEHVGRVTYPSRAAASRADAVDETANGYSQIETEGTKLAIVRSSS
jgi:hypothetical protein